MLNPSYRRGTRSGRALRLVLLAGVAALGAPAWAQKGDPATQEPGQPARGQPIPPAHPQGDTIIIDQLSEPWELRSFVEWVAQTLEINVIGSDSLSGSVVLNVPMEVSPGQLLALLDSLLEAQGHTIIKDPQGFYRIQSLDQVALQLGDEQAATRIIPTPGIRPTALENTVKAHLQGPDKPANKITYLDDLGVIIITDSPRRIASLRGLIDQILALQADQQFLRYEVEHVAAGVARQRAIDLLGGGPGQPQLVPGQEGQINLVQTGGFAPLSQRLTVDAQGNALFFRGTLEEAQVLERALAVIDVPNNLETRVYFAGAAASAIADIAVGRGLGEVQQVQSSAASAEAGGGAAPGITPGRMPQPMMQQPGMPGQEPEAPGGGPTMVVDTSRGIILYSGTKSQHEEIAAIIKEFDAEQDQIVILTYPLNHQKANEVADLIVGILMNQSVEGGSSGGLLPEQRGSRGTGSGMRGRTGSQRNRNQFQTNEFSPFSGLSGLSGQGSTPQTASLGGPGGGGEGDIFVLADEKNNQIIVKAPQKMQADFAGLIEKLDLRRPQVYLEATVVSVTASDEFRLAFNYQLVNQDGTGGALDFNTGLGGFGEDGNFQDPKAVSTGLVGLTAALIKSEYVPVIITALQSQAETRVLSTPQLLVDDNETASLLSLEEQPTSITTQSDPGNPLQTGFGDYEQAGTELTVTPTIAKGGYIRLEYLVSLSSFVGSASGGLPPPRLTNEVSGDSVTVPGDTTVVLGGLTVDALRDTVVKVPLLGDIPIIKHLFRDKGKTNRKTVLYVFLTPRILREPSIPDLILLTQGPQAAAGLNFDLPQIEPPFIEIFELTAPEPAPPTQRPPP